MSVINFPLNKHQNWNKLNLKWLQKVFKNKFNKLGEIIFDFFDKKNLKINK